MEIVATGKRVRIYVGQHDRVEGRHEPLWQTLLNLLRAEGAAGASVFHGLAGFGVHGKLNVAGLVEIVPDLPILVEWIDGPERVERLLPRVAALVTTGVITVEDVDIVKYAHRAPRALPPATVAEAMTREVVTVHPETPVGEVVRMLLYRDYRALPVVDRAGKLVGMITNGDLVERGGLSARVDLLAALGGAALEAELARSGVRGKTAGDVMSRQITTVGPGERLDRAAHLMVERGIKRLPVVDAEGHLIGIISRVDILKAMGESYQAPPLRPPPRPADGRTAGDLMHPDAPVVLVTAQLGEIVDAVTATPLNRAVVVDEERRVVGVVSDADLLAKLDPGAETGLLAALTRRGRAPNRARISAREVMRAPAVTVTHDTPVAEAARVMVEARLKVLPVVDAAGRFLGVVDRADLLSALHQHPAA